MIDSAPAFPDSDVCYSAMLSRDARFDGRFFIAVRTSGVYCRPVCPARTPKRENVDFYRCAAAAESAGFRPCLRCRPETSPGTPAWLGTSVTVSRAMRYINAGALDDSGVDDLALRLGIGARHLRRLFDEHLGASPLAVAQTRRVQFAKKLITETGLNMTRIAMESGFSSVRRFNAAVKQVYGVNPSELRRVKSLQNGQADASGFSLKLSYRPPLEWDGHLDFLSLRAIPGVERIANGAYERSVEIDGKAGLVRVTQMSGTDCLRLDVGPELAGALMTIVERMRRVFDLRADPAEICEVLGRDPLLRERVRCRPGLRIPGAFDGFEMAIRAILGQQVTVKGASTLAGRIAHRYGRPLAGDDDFVLFPHAADLAEADFDGIGLPKARAATIRALATALALGTIDLDATRDLNETIEALERLPGIGAWTANYIAIRALGEPDAFPDSDLGLRKAVGGNKGLATPATVRERAEAWRPWRAYGAVHLWAA
jgi:AraC family transcriptional regulator of adaptative response / DNA-3-methyladenine glycosylase II